MADNRCAIPEYQLDADSMMIEYVLYHAIKAELNAQDAELQGSRHRKESKEKAQRLCENFDILIRLFYHHHPDVTLSEGTDFNIKILEFLVLLRQWLNRDLCYGRLSDERAFNTKHRRAWLRSWTKDSSGPGRNIKSHIDSTAQPMPENPLISLEDLLVRFLDLSAEVALVIGCVNSNWYTLAAEFMLQTTIERLHFLLVNNAVQTDKKTSLQTLSTWLSECFAWGIVQPCPTETFAADESSKQAEKYLNTQIFIRNMFSLRTDQDIDGDIHMSAAINPDSSLTEDPTWTSTRIKLHSDVLNILKPSRTTTLGQVSSSPLTESSDLENALVAFQSTHHLSTFLTNLIDFIEGIHCLNVDNISGKPVLVQIEEGGLDGLNNEDFRVFLDKVGLKMGERGVRWIR